MLHVAFHCHFVIQKQQVYLSSFYPSLPHFPQHIHSCTSSPLPKWPVKRTSKICYVCTDGACPDACLIGILRSPITPQLLVPKPQVHRPVHSQVHQIHPPSTRTLFQIYRHRRSPHCTGNILSVPRTVSDPTSFQHVC